MTVVGGRINSGHELASLRAGAPHAAFGMLCIRLRTHALAADTFLIPFRRGNSHTDKSGRFADKLGIPIAVEQ